MKHTSKILRDICALVLASALAFLPVAAIHSCAEAHPLADTSGVVSESESSAATATETTQEAQAETSQEQPDQQPQESAQEQTQEQPQQTSIDAQTLSSYYLTNGGFVTSVKLQNPWGACWAFSIASAIESSILKAQTKLENTYSDREKEAAEASSPKLSGLSNEVDISERAIAWLSHELQDEASAGSQAGEGLYRVDPNDFKTQLAGGNFSIVEAALAARQGLLSESSAPYQYNGYQPGATPWYSVPPSGADARSRDWSLNDELRNVNDVGWYVSDIVNLPSPVVTQYDFSSEAFGYVGYDADATRAIKQALVDIGAVAISLEAETSLPGDARSTSHFDYNTWSQYNATNSMYTNHAVTIVGWDDSYSTSNFSGTESGQPPANGAWLCKNNWGSDALYRDLGGSADATHWGISDNGEASGFFWLSYYDHTITAPVAFEVQPTDDVYDNLYQYDYLGISEYSEPSSYVDVLRVGNVFTAEKTEMVKSITAQTFREDETVSYWIYLLPMESNNDNSGEDGENDGKNAAADSASSTNESKTETNKADSNAQSIIFSEKINIDGVDNGPTGNGTLATAGECTFEYAGFHEIELDSPVLVAAGQRFAVVERVKSNVELEADSPEASYLNLELAFTNPPEGDLPVETMAQVVSNPGETYVSVQSDWWMSLEEFNNWYTDAQNGEPDMIFGNALIKALTNDTSMSNGSQIYELVRLNG